MLEWKRSMADFAHRQFAWWLYGPMPSQPKVPRVWAADMSEMLWLSAWPRSSSFASSDLGQALACERDDPDPLHVQADKLQAEGNPLGLAVSMRALGLGNRLAVALEVFERATELRWADALSEAAR